MTFYNKKHSISKAHCASQSLVTLHKLYIFTLRKINHQIHITDSTRNSVFRVSLYFIRRAVIPKKA